MTINVCAILYVYTCGESLISRNLCLAKKAKSAVFTRGDAGKIADYARVPDQGYGDVLDGVRCLLLFALDLLTVGRIDQQVDSAYVNALEWYHTLSEVFA